MKKTGFLIEPPSKRGLIVGPFCFENFKSIS